MKIKILALYIAALLPIHSFGSSVNVVSVDASNYDISNNHSPLNSVDGNLKTRWAAQGKETSLILELDKTTNIENIVLVPFKGNERSLKFDILVSLDKNKWDVVSSNLHTAKDKAAGEKFVFKPVMAKYVKLLNYGTDVNNWSAIWEVYVNSDDPLYKESNVQ